MYIKGKWALLIPVSRHKLKQCNVIQVISNMDSGHLGEKPCQEKC